MRKFGTEFILGKNELNLPPNKVVMKHILCALMVIASPVLWAQSLTADAVVYAENGEKFHLYLNGELMNEDPKTNLKLKGLTSEFYQARVDFVDASLPILPIIILLLSTVLRLLIELSLLKTVTHCVIFLKDLLKHNTKWIAKR